MKQCANCGKEFYCVPCKDVGGTLPEQKNCSWKCAKASMKYSADKLIEQFWTRVDKNGPNGCWIYLGHRNKDNYGAIRVNGVFLAHRLTWMLKNGPIPKGLHALHKCHNPPCCNPDHLYLGDDAQNMADKVAIGNTNRGERCIHAKLTADQVREIRAAYRYWREGSFKRSNAKELAQKYGVSHLSIVAAANRRSWKHIP